METTLLACSFPREDHAKRRSRLPPGNKKPAEAGFVAYEEILGGLQLDGLHRPGPQDQGRKEKLDQLYGTRVDECRRLNTVGPAVAACVVAAAVGDDVQHGNPLPRWAIKNPARRNARRVVSV